MASTSKKSTTKKVVARQCDRGYEIGYRKINIGVTNPKTRKQYCVYRYIDIEDNTIKYVGIVRSGFLCDRIQSHEREDKWCQNKPWRIEYFECDTQSEVEAFEAHLIALYGTYKYYNKQKASWGINKYLPNVEKWWKPATIPVCEDNLTLKAVYEFKKALRENRINDARQIIKMIELMEV